MASGQPTPRHLAAGAPGRTRMAPAAQAMPHSAANTQTQTETQNHAPPAILRLRGAHASSGRSVQWDESVVDNEGLGRKSSKVCCIYHGPRGVDESSDESSSDSSGSSSDSDSDLDEAKGPGASKAGENSGSRDTSKKNERKSQNKNKKKKKKHQHSPDCPDHAERHNHRGRRSDQADTTGRRKPSPNAYEKMPRSKPRGGGGSAPDAPAHLSST